MDDYTWQSRILERQRKNRRDKISIALLICIALCFGAWLWYFFVYTRTPEYALNGLQEAITQKDAAAFNRYVNMDLLTAKAYDDLTLDLFSYDASLTPQTKALFEKFYVLVKPQLTQGMEETIKTRISSGEWQLPDGSDILKGRQLGIDYERFLERTQLQNTTLLSIGEIKTNGRSADAEVHIQDDYTQTEFTLELVLEQNDDGRWQVAYIKNYRAYLDTVSPLHNQDIANYIAATKTIVDDYNTKFSTQQTKFKNLTKTTRGRLSQSQKQGLKNLLEKEVIPSLQARQEKLAAIEVPNGATYLSQLRQKSTDLTIDSWKHFITGIMEDRPAELDTAESLHKQELEIDLRIEDIIKHTKKKKNIPNIP